MTIKEILHTTAHRPWNMPSNPWAYYQEWNNAIFLHYQVDLSLLQPFVPQALEIDLFNGKPWVSVVAFTMEKIRPRYLPAFPPISNFDEINIRTYVRSNGKAGVYFLSIEGGTSLSCKIAKSLSGLPYRFSKMSRPEGIYKSSNSEFNDHLHIAYTIGEKTTEKTELDLWLTERYALFQDTKDVINAFDIHHLEWPINTINIDHLELNYPRFAGLFKDRKPDRVHYSKGVKVLAWGKQKQ
ncbi:YqjF family protein [Winogradskyella sp.]|uniref:YqjF family protein n=1 Tax=Winogradskyella sp. TaxID=1883156 RepID=UPI003BAD408A